ncbi:hypothetical protein VTK73DRAFT_10256 [Phialemonium thermophilum]|uniref:Intradiol ring-cleavage dioxygenases domain-containing protein n=1 Tax=Phialemonium thermophilum TaxID=223376 RepID=A0ABR3VXN2_9PEZI
MRCCGRYNEILGRRRTLPSTEVSCGGSLSPGTDVATLPYGPPTTATKERRIPEICPTGDAYCAGPDVGLWGMQGHPIGVDQKADAANASLCSATGDREPWRAPVATSNGGTIHGVVDAREETSPTNRGLADQDGTGVETESRQRDRRSTARRTMNPGGTMRAPVLGTHATGASPSRDCAALRPLNRSGEWTREGRRSSAAFYRKGLGAFHRTMGALAHLLVLALVALTRAHPGESHSPGVLRREIVARDHAADRASRSLGQCAGSAAARALRERAVRRRAKKVQELREKRNIQAPAHKWRRDLAALEAWEQVPHNRTGSASYDMFTALETVFDANASCILAPEVTDGPYYVVGEYLRSNVKEPRYCDGVDLFLEVQYVDVATCAPVPAVAVDIWNCNATGVYSGISTAGNYAAGGYNSTYLRGVQLTDHDGVVQFETIFPGHYQGRATHTHLLAHLNATVAPNGTVAVARAPVTHIGQLFYPEDLRAAVERVYPYTTNTQPVTSNDDDMWSIVQASSSYDPFPQFVYLGDDVRDGLFAWIQIGVNTSADYSSDDYYAVAAYLDADGGHANADAFPGGGGGGVGGGNGTGPSGPGPSNLTLPTAAPAKV